MMQNNGVVHLIDDDDDVRRAVAFLLGTAGMAVRVHESALAFLNQLEKLQPGCVLTDIRMPGMDGLELQRRLRDMGNTMPVVVMTGHGDIPLAVTAMKLGAVDFIEKPFDDEVLVSAIRNSLGHFLKSDQATLEKASIVSKIDKLTDREKEVMDGLVAGHANKTIAYDLSLSPRTVEVHRANVMIKMEADSLSHLVKMAILARAGIT